MIVANQTRIKEVLAAAMLAINFYLNIFEPTIWRWPPSTSRPHFEFALLGIQESTSPDAESQHGPWTNRVRVAMVGSFSGANQLSSHHPHTHTHTHTHVFSGSVLHFQDVGLFQLAFADSKSLPKALCARSGFRAFLITYAFLGKQCTVKVAMMLMWWWSWCWRCWFEWEDSV